MEPERRPFNVLAHEDPPAAVRSLYEQRERLELWLRGRYGHRLGDVGLELVIDEAFQRALDFSYAFDPTRDLEPWLRRIAENCARDALAELEVCRRALEPRTLGASGSEEPSEELEALQLALGGLTSDERLVLLSEEPAETLGRRLHCTRGHVYNRRSSVLRRVEAVLRRTLREWRGG